MVKGNYICNVCLNKNGHEIQAKAVTEELFNVHKMKEKALSLCKEFIGGAWKSISCNDMVFKRIGGGLVNLLYYCSLPTSVKPLQTEPNELLLRLYGKIHEDGAGDAVVKENVIFMLLSERLLGPKLYGIFSGGRLEEYIDAPCLKRSHLLDPEISSCIAEKLALVHNLNVPIKKEPTFLFSTGTRWLTKINSMISRQPENQEEKMKFERLLSFNLDSEFKWLWSVLNKLDSPVVFSHNDLQQGNILYNSKAEKRDEKLIFIDFEFCSYNFRAFDFANHFIEFIYDYDVKSSPYFKIFRNEYPSRQQQLRFLRSYLNPNLSLTNGNADIADDDVASIEEEALLYEIEVFLLASHMFWALWGFINAYDSKILFGYWDYAEERLFAYFQHKKHLMTNNQKFSRMVEELE